jgi:hypothetical protein
MDLILGHWCELLIGYVQRSTDEHDVTAQKDALGPLGVEPTPIDVDRGLTGTNKL